jgi:hypothetical protein
LAIHRGPLWVQERISAIVNLALDVGWHAQTNGMGVANVAELATP